MGKPIISMIAAIGKNRELGKSNKLLWHIPDDLKKFKEITMGHPVIMGRTTFESIGKPLPGRENIVISRNRELKLPECIVVNSIKEAIVFASKKDCNEIFIIGGSQIYNLGIKHADKLYLTLIDKSMDADTYFPDYSSFAKLINKKDKSCNGIKYSFIELVR
jgi:dihydrofolate reductase